MEANAKPIPMEEPLQKDEGGDAEETITDDDVPQPFDIAFLPTGPDDYTNQAKKEEEESKLGKLEIIWVSNNPYYTGLIVAATVLLLGAAMLVTVTSNGAQKRTRTSLVDISQHPSWPKMEESLGVAMAHGKKNGGHRDHLFLARCFRRGHEPHHQHIHPPGRYPYLDC
jgi:hypothetical protein